MEAASDKEIASLEKHGVDELVPITAVPAGQRVIGTRCVMIKHLLNKLKKPHTDRFDMTDAGDVSRVLGVNVTRDREKGTITIDQKDYTEDIVESFGMMDSIRPSHQERDLNVR